MTRPGAVSIMGWVHAVGEGALLGLLSGGLLAAWQARLQADISHETLWLGMDRSLPFLVTGAGTGLLLSVGLALLLVSALRPAGVLSRVLTLGAGSACLLTVWILAEMLHGQVLSFLPWTGGRMEFSVYAAISAMAAMLALLRVLGRGLQSDPGAFAVPRRLAAFSGLVLLFICGSAWAGWAPLNVLRAGDRPSIILISLDTLRADRLGSMGYARDTTPLLDELAAEGMVFENAISPAPWTLPAHASLLTSQFPNEHRVLRVSSRVRPEHLILAESLRNHGYATAAFTGGGYVSAGYGYNQGFQIYQESDEATEGGPATIAAAALDWVRGVADRPFFLFLHTYEPHGPYLDKRFADPADRGRLTDEMIAGTVGSIDDPTAGERRYMEDLYDGDIARTDQVMGGLLKTLKQAGVLDRAIVMITSDHGEDLWDHDATNIPRHGHTLYEEMVHVPFILRAPGLVPAGTRITNQVSLIDLAPTLMGLAGLQPSRSMRGQDMTTAVRAGLEPEERPLLSEAVRYGPPRFAWRDGETKIILTPNPAVVDKNSTVIPDPLEIFDLASDPLEQLNLAATPPPVTRVAIELLRERARLEAGDGAEISGHVQDEELREQLRSLGYLD